MWPAGDKKQPAQPGSDDLAAHLLKDHAQAASQYLMSLKDQGARVDFILDNVGVELAYDIGLVDILFQNRIASEICFHVKLHPTFVSDAISKDVVDVIEYFEIASDDKLRALAQRLHSWLDQGSLRIETHPYWTSPLSGWEMPPDLRENLSHSNLIISKGDANYRRWLGDRNWPFTTPLANVVNYLPAPFLALRVLKSNILVGLTPGVSDAMDMKDPQWLTNGSWGIIQFEPIDRRLEVF